MHLVVVESPAKARTIEKYLGKDYKVLASYGHIRDLPPKDGSVDPADNFAMQWQPTKESSKAVSALAKAMKEADSLFLATDPDREGEAIAWHVYQTLEGKKLLKNKEVQRIVFYEITKKAVLAALKAPRALNQELIDAYLARRALDYLVGFNLSPVLWRKLPGSKSAGRVQSVALRLITERDAEIERFIPQEYWSITVNCLTDQKEKFTARLTHAHGEKLDKLSLSKEGDATKIVQALEGQALSISTLEKKNVKRHAQPPFTTSTLQQEASRKLRFSANQTMRVAQSLYEGVPMAGGETVGLITYMRTDSVSMAQEAVQGCRQYIEKNYAGTYLPDQPLSYKNKVKNAQEAHEAVRPTDFMRTPAQVKGMLNDQQYKLYDLIWKRAIASQMTPAVREQVTADLETADQNFMLRATGSRLLFDGFLSVYEEGSDQVQEAEGDLPALQKGQSIEQESIDPAQHFTQPPGRYTEASLVKKMEELGIGRPSTYASILYVLQARSYVRLEKRAFHAEDRGRLVSAFLEHYFKQYVEYDFTANLEEQLDSIASGGLAWVEVLKSFWAAFEKAIGQTKDLKISDVLDMLDEALESHFFNPLKDKDSRQCPQCEKGTLRLKIGKYGAFIGCGGYPDCTYIRKIGEDDVVEETVAGDTAEYPKILGDHKEGGQVSLRKGPYGFYVQLDIEGQKGKPKRSSLPKGFSPQSITLEQATFLLEMPQTIGADPESGEEILVGIGRYGPYVKKGAKFYSLKNTSVFDVTLEDALEVIRTSKK